MAKSLTIQEKKDYAKLLFIKENISQKDISLKVGVSQKTMSKWVNDEHWDDLRKSLITTKESQIRWLYSVIDNIKRLYEVKDENGNDATVMDSKTADTIIKLTASIRNLETQDITIAEMLSVGKRAILWAQANMPEDVQTLTDIFDGFIRSSINRG